MTPVDYSFEGGLKTEQDFDAAITLLYELHETHERQYDSAISHNILKLSYLIEKFQRERYLVFYNGYSC
jgi:hypothetical protein